MDHLDGMRTFAQVVASGSFTGAATRLGISKKLISKYVATLEDRLGARLLNRTTRSLSLTETGALYHQRCVQLLEDLDELELSVQARTARPRGKLFISAPTTYGEMYLVPQISAFRTKYPDITIDLRLSDRHVDLVNEGFDLAVRIGHLESSGLIARKLGPAPLTVCASPNYLEANGYPDQPEDLRHHQCIIDTNMRSGTSWPFLVNGKRTNVKVSGDLAVNSARSARDFALLDKGITRSPDYVVDKDLKAGRLVTLLSGYIAQDFDVFAVYSSSRNLAPKVRAFIDFLSDAFKQGR